jgi:predicted molibdopterin-dependent oxidoreductase YjgC
MFERVRPAGAGAVTILVDGKPVSARTGDTVAAALLAAGITGFRVNAADGALRGPYCLMGICQECRIAIDGNSAVPACTTQVADGMRITLDPRPADG